MDVLDTLRFFPDAKIAKIGARLGWPSSRFDHDDELQTFTKAC